MNDPLILFVVGHNYFNQKILYSSWSSWHHLWTPPKEMLSNFLLIDFRSLRAEMVLILSTNTRENLTSTHTHTHTPQQNVRWTNWTKFVDWVMWPFRILLGLIWWNAYNQKHYICYSELLKKSFDYILSIAVIMSKHFFFWN
jgi:hypothetical protein